MKLILFTLLTSMLSFVANLSTAQKSVYKIIKAFAGTFEGDIDTNEIKKLDEPLRAVAALYSSMAGTRCDTTTCELTTALGLGDQGSDAHIALIKKYFPHDKVAKRVIAQYCTLGRDGSSDFSDYEYLTLSKLKDTFKVSYLVNYYDHGKDSHTKGQDVYLFRKNEFNMLKRKLWDWADKN